MNLITENCKKTLISNTNEISRLKDVQKLEKRELRNKTIDKDEITNFKNKIKTLKATNTKINKENSQLKTDLKRLQDDMESRPDEMQDQWELEEIQNIKSKIKDQYEMIKRFNFSRITSIEDLNESMDSTLLNFNIKKPELDVKAANDDYEKEMNRILKIKIELMKSASMMHYIIQL